MRSVPAISGLLLLALAAGGARAEAPSREYQAKAAILFQVTQFAEWPAEAFGDAESPFLIGVLGDDPFGPLLDQAVKGQRQKGHPLEVRRYKTPETLEGCHLLFVCRSEKDRLQEILKRLEAPAARRWSTLTAGEEPVFAEQGGVLQIGIQERKIHLQINVDAAARAKLRISSQLLRLATIVRDEEREKAGSRAPGAGHDRRIETAGRPGAPRDARGCPGA
jgi:hypothetical protein